MTKINGLKQFFFGKKNKKLYSPEFSISDNVVKDFKISEVIPRYGKNYFKLVSCGSVYELYIRSFKENRDDKVYCRSTLLKKYNKFGEIKTLFKLNIESLLPYIGSVTIDIQEKSTCYIFRFLREDEEINIDGYLKVYGEPGVDILEKLNEFIIK